MRWTSMELAALATAAVPGLSPTGVAAVADDARDFTAAIVVDSEGNRWRIRSPQHQEAAMRLETELQVLRGFTTSIRAELPFRAPSVAGAVRRGEMRTFVYNHLPGQVVELDELAGQGPELLADVGRTIAAIHDLDESVVDNADLPRYSAERFRQRRLNELDQAATTGQIPATLLRRWEHAMEEKQLWDFAPAVTHGDLHEDSLLIEGERVVAVTGWTDLHIGDPADDFAWLTATPDTRFSRAVLSAYESHRRGSTDPHLLRRAALTAEFALAQWLVRGHATENQEMVEEARGLLRQLEEDVEAHGGQPIALSPMEGEQPAPTQDSKPVARAGAAATVADTGEWADSGVDDHEPAVITDASAEADQESTPAHSDDGSDDGDDGEQAVFEDDTPTGTIAPVPEQRRPSTGELPIVPDADSEKRAKQKNFFPSQSANSARSAPSAESAEIPAAQQGQGPTSAASEEPDSSADPEAAAEPEETEGTAEQDHPSSPSSSASTQDSVYSSYPGLRPPGS